MLNPYYRDNKTWKKIFFPTEDRFQDLFIDCSVHYPLF